MNAMQSTKTSTAASTAAILASVRPRNIRQGEPIAFRTGFKKIL